MLNTNLQLLEIVCSDQISTDRYRGLRSHAGLPEFDTRLLVCQRPDAHWVVVEDDLIKARCSLWWRHTPTAAAGKTGLIGHYASVDDDSANALLPAVQQRLAAQGCALALGPMNQNTWRDYRFITDFGDQPPFFLEPDGLPQWRDQFERNGFRAVVSYFSSLAEDLTTRSQRVQEARDRLAAHPIEIRPLQRDRLKADLKRIHSVVQIAFQENPFFVPVSETEFLEMYRPLEPLIEPDLVLLAWHRERMVGFVFAVPDLLQARRGLPVDTVIVKTFGVLPDRSYAGLGQVLLEEVHHRAASRGFRRAIHALVRDEPHLRRTMFRYGQPFRRYALFGKEL